MNKLLKTYSALLFLLLTIPVKGQQNTIVIGYGETFETIANKYDLSVSELREANPDKNECYAGMEIVIPRPIDNPVGDTGVTSAVLMRADSLLLEAKAINQSGKHKKAIKLYNKVIEMKVRTPYAFAGRGECYFNLKKYKKAKADLNHAINSGQLAIIERNWCMEALGDVEKAIQAKRERKNAVWSKVGLAFVTAAAVTTTAYVASEQAKMQNQNQLAHQNYQNSMTYGGGGSDHLKNADQIIAQSNAYNNRMNAAGTAQLNQMTQTMMIEAQKTRNRMEQAFQDELKWKGEFNKANGRYPTEYETDRWYEANYPDLLNNRILARGKMNSESHDDDKKEKEDIRTKTDYSEKFETRYSSGEVCVSCLGSGKCKTCNGRGYYYNSLNISRTVLCPNCDHDHNGVCSHCHGTKVNP